MDQFVNTQLFITLFRWLAPLSLATFILSLIIIPLIIARLSINCFINISRKKEPARLSGTSIAFLLFRNIGGIFFLTAGFAMLFLPGQGLLTILIGLLLLTFPGKQTMINFLIAKPSLQHSLDWIRKKTGKPPFIWP
ncbi:MAG: hypothetical protein JRC87_09175 [Deltaproteobacteria bacterium]|nr:hypothetical protein [Deltaproteobacteria bacterium]MBW2659740.1 hypothetical protein [Deltaproteobacteria bacterium]